MRWIAQFRNVGRGKASWDVEFDRCPTDGALLAAIKKRKALGSRGIDFDRNEAGDEAGIYVGGFRKVGSVRIAAPSPAPAGEPEEVKP